MSEGERSWTSEAFREQVRSLVGRVEAGDVEEAAMELWRVAFAQVDEWVFAQGVWNIWGGITDEFTHPRGDREEGCRLASASAAALGRALGQESCERAYCDAWVSRICR